VSVSVGLVGDICQIRVEDIHTLKLPRTSYLLPFWPISIMQAGSWRSVATPPATTRSRNLVFRAIKKRVIDELDVRKAEQVVSDNRLSPVRVSSFSFFFVFHYHA